MRDSDFDRLILAARAGEPEADAPFGFDTRVVALWRAARGQHARAGAELARLARRIVLAAAVVTIFSGVGAYWELTENDETAEPLTNAYAIADTEIESGIFQ